MERGQYLRHTGEITEWDEATFRRLVSTEIDAEGQRRITHPDLTFRREKSVLAIHWHPEMVPLEMVAKRIDAMFPGRERELIIPTQHNQLMAYEGFSGVEVDSYSPEFNRKIQLLFHFREDRLKGAELFRGMLNHTFQYRRSQLFEFIETILAPKFSFRLQEAIDSREAEKELIEFVKLYTRKVKLLIDRLYGEIPEISLKNKLLANYFTELVEFYDERTVNKALILLKKIKKIVKKYFALDYFYRTEEVIEEGRSFGAGIVIPHPEQFWPVLLADYDVDGIEVWNPQSQQYTEFLIKVVNKKNRYKEYRKKPLLVFMGDDTHLGEKLLEPRFQRKEKAQREVGHQPAWNDIMIQKTLVYGQVSKEKVIEEYRQRLLLA